MSTKEWISDLTNGVGVYQECIYDSDNHVVNPNPAVIQLDHSAGTTISHKMINDPTFRIKFRNKSLGIMCQVHQ